MKVAVGAIMAMYEVVVAVGGSADRGGDGSGGFSSI